MYGKVIIPMATMIAVSFVCGVFVFRYIPIESAEVIIQLLDKRLLSLQLNNWYTIVPVAISVFVVLLFSTHPFFYFISILFISLKCVFMGFGSVYIMDILDSTSLYIRWWFPFQFMYIVLLLMLYGLTRVKIKRKRNKALKMIPIIFLIISLTVYLETIVISSVLK